MHVWTSLQAVSVRCLRLIGMARFWLVLLTNTHLSAALPSAANLLS